MPHTGFLYEIDLDKLKENEGKKDEHTQPLLYPVLEFFDKKWEIPKSCLFHGARFGSKGYILCNEIKFPCRSPLRPTDAFCFDTNDLESTLQRFSPPKSAKIWCVVISAYGKLYYLAYPSCYPNVKKDSFERYDLEKILENLCHHIHIILRLISKLRYPAMRFFMGIY